MPFALDSSLEVCFAVDQFTHEVDRKQAVVLALFAELGHRDAAIVGRFVYREEVFAEEVEVGLGHSGFIARRPALRRELRLCN
ncbi:MAG: hypothetical protein ACREA0_02430 [bacterium]